jgi:YbgC/YbaW family acyl-CoA thioester hydrolase
MFSIKIDVAPAQIEPLYNHVHHAQALRYLELGRLAYLESIGLPNNSLIAKHLFLVITEISVNYKRELTGGEITVTCENPRIDEKRIVLDQKILNPKGKVAVEGTIVSQMLSGETKRSVVPPDFFLHKFVD